MYTSKVACMHEREGKREGPAREAEGKWALGPSLRQGGWRCASLWACVAP